MNETNKIEPNQGKLLNGIALAYIGDAVWEVYVRDHLLSLGLTKPAQLQKAATKYVSAKAQAKLVEDWVLSEEELGYFLRGRNAHSRTTAKNTDVVTYRISTGFEAVFGFLHLTRNYIREAQLAELCLKAIVDDLNSGA